MCYVYKSTLIHLAKYYHKRGVVHKIPFRDGNDNILSSAVCVYVQYSTGILFRIFTLCWCYSMFVESDKRKPRDDPLVRTHDHLAPWSHQFKDNITFKKIYRERETLVGKK